MLSPTGPRRFSLIDKRPVLLATATLTLCLLGCQSQSGSSADPGSGGRSAGGGGTGGKGSGGSGMGENGSGGRGSDSSGGQSTGNGGDSGQAEGGAGGTGSGGMGASGGNTGDAGLGPDASSGTTDAPPAADGANGGPPYGDLAALDKACTPIFTLELTDKGPKGQIFVDAMGGSIMAVEDTVQKISREVCRVLYRKGEEVRPANRLQLEILDNDGVAAKFGDVGDIGIEISTQHLQNVKNENRDVGAEIKGILYHEITHMYQNDDKPEGTWSGLANYYEAGADAVRIRSGFAPSGCKPGNKTGQWYDKNYCDGGWWWLFVDTRHPGFLYQLNLQMAGKNGKAWKPADATAIAGESLDAMWTAYKSAACCSGNDTSCCK
jgi:hypothetical protein